MNNLKHFITSFFKNMGKQFSEIAQQSWKTASVGALLGFLFYVLANVRYIRIGIAPIVDIFIVIVLFVIAGAILFVSFKYLFGEIRKFNASFVAVLLTLLLLASFLPGYFFTRLFLFFELICGGIAGWAIYKGLRKPSPVFLLLMVAGLNVGLFYFLFSDGWDKTIPVSDTYRNQSALYKDMEDPSAVGSYHVNELFYGSGTDKNRKEYAGQITIRTETVDATPFFDRTEGLQNKLLTFFWGFDSGNYPLNGRVWYPEGEGRFPLIVVAHGNHLMYDYSDPGYEYLGRLLASRGYIVVSIDENFLNGDWKSDFGHQELFTRGWIILKHLENWREWNDTEENPFHDRVDMENIALIGHSRGGPAVMWASVINKLERYYDNAAYTFDFNFPIKAIIQIAPSELYFQPRKEIPVKLEDVDYLLLYGGHDQDLFTNLGNRFYNDIGFSGQEYHFKSALYIYRANHGQFNTVWGRRDRSTAEGWFLNLKPILDESDQRKITELYISAFAEVSLKGNKELLPVFKDYRVLNRFLPEDYYYNQFDDSSSKDIADFEEDLDVTTATLPDSKISGENLKTWKENVLIFKDHGNTSQNTSGVYLGWDLTDKTISGTPIYTISLNQESLRLLQPEDARYLYFTSCNNSDTVDQVDFTIELVAKGKSISKRFSDLFILPPVLRQELSKCDYLYSLGKSGIHERVLQYVEWSVSEMKRMDPEFAFEELEQIRFLFDQTESGEIIMDKIGIGGE